MPSVSENVGRWSRHAWEHEGHRWSPGGTAAGTAMMWSRSIRPRLHDYLPADTVLEVGSGFGRWTARLLTECRRLIGVDVTERAVTFCRERFPHRARFWVNDGQSLPMVPDASVDLCFSLDSLVHAEAAQVRGYLHELARVLKPGGAAFLHHSNLAAYADAAGAIPAYVRERYWRGASVSARLVREACREAGLVCVTQELINWVGRDSEVERHCLAGTRVPLTDSFLLCVRPSETVPPPFTRVYINREFVEEWRGLDELVHAYGAPGSFAAGGTGRGPGGGRNGRRVIPTGLRSRIAGWVFRYREPLTRAVMKGRCPDCGRRLTATQGRADCHACRISLLVR